MKREITLISGFVLGAVLLVTSSAFAAQVVVSDCLGMIRAVGDSGESSNTNILVALVAKENSSTDGVAVTLSNGVDTHTATSKEGKLKFEKVSAGRWTACVAKENVTLGDVSVVKANPDSEIGPLALLGAGLAGAGGIALGGLSSGSSESGLSGPPSALAGSAQRPIVDVGEDTGLRPAEAARRNNTLDTEDDCLTNESPAVLSEFL